MFSGAHGRGDIECPVNVGNTSHARACISQSLNLSKMLWNVTACFDYDENDEDREVEFTGLYILVRKKEKLSHSYVSFETFSVCVFAVCKEDLVPDLFGVQEGCRPHLGTTSMIHYCQARCIDSHTMGFDMC